MPIQAPTPTAPPSFLRTDGRVNKHDEQRKAHLRKRIEQRPPMVEDAQIVHDTTLNPQPSERSRESARKDYEENMNVTPRLEQEEAEDSNSRRSHSSVPLTQPPVSRKKSPSRQRRPSTSILVEDVDDEDNENSSAHTTWRGSQLHTPRQARRRPSPGSQAPAWRPVPPAPEPSGISRAFVHANRQIYSPRSVLFPRRGSVNSTEIPSSSAGLHRAGSLNPDQHRGSSTAHKDTESRPVRSHDPMVSNTALRERENISLTSPHDKPCPSTYPTILRQAITDDTPSNDNTRQGIAIPRKHANPESPLGTPWGSLRHPSFNDSNVLRSLTSEGDPTLSPVLSDPQDIIHGQLDYQHGTHSVRSGRSVCAIQSIKPEQTAVCWETEAQRKEPEPICKENEARRRVDEALLLEEKARQSLMEAESFEAGARQAQASAKMREAAAQKKEAEAKRNEAEAKMREAEAQRKLEVARQRELEAHLEEEEAKRAEEEVIKQEEEIRRKEEDARTKEDDTRKRLKDARQEEMLARQMEEVAHRFEQNVQKEDEAMRKEDEARRREEEEDELRTKEEHKEHRLAQEAVTRQALGSSRHERKVAPREAEDAARVEATKADTANLFAEVESDVPEQKKQPKAQSQAQAKQQRDEALEEQQHFEFLEEEKRRKQERLQWEQEEQIRLDEELRRLEQARLDREARLEQERLLADAQERETKRLREKQRRAVDEKWHLRLEEQRRKIPDQSRQRDQPYQQQQRHKDEILSQHAKEQQQEFERSQYQRTMGPERQNNVGASFDSSIPHPPAGSRSGVVPAPGSSVGSTWSSRPSHNAPASSSVAFPALLKPSLASTGPGARRTPGTSAPNLEEEEWARRAEERARQQQEQFKREQERLESEQQVKKERALPERRPTDYTKVTGRSGISSRSATVPQHVPFSTARPSQRR